MIDMIYVPISIQYICECVFVWISTYKSVIEIVPHYFFLVDDSDSHYRPARDGFCKLE